MTLTMLVLISLFIIYLILFIINRKQLWQNKIAFVSAIGVGIVILVITALVVFRSKPVTETVADVEEDMEETETKPVHVWLVTKVFDEPLEDIETLSKEDMLNITLPLWKTYTEENSLPVPTYTDKMWMEDDGMHAYLQSTLGDQTYEVCINEVQMALDFYGSSFHKGYKGVIYGTCSMKGVDIAKIERQLISAGYGDYAFTFKEVGDDYVLLESETGFTQRLSK